MTFLKMNLGSPTYSDHISLNITTQDMKIGQYDQLNFPYYALHFSFQTPLKEYNINSNTKFYNIHFRRRTSSTCVIKKFNTCKKLHPNSIKTTTMINFPRDKLIHI